MWSDGDRALLRVSVDTRSTACLETAGTVYSTVWGELHGERSAMLMMSRGAGQQGRSLAARTPCTCCIMAGRSCARLCCLSRAGDGRWQL
jgi:hypothetical protein